MENVPLETLGRYAGYDNFTYDTGQTLIDTCDDDAFDYINNALVIDLDGFHGSTSSKELNLFKSCGKP